MTTQIGSIELSKSEVARLAALRPPERKCPKCNGTQFETPCAYPRECRHPDNKQLILWRLALLKAYIGKTVIKTTEDKK